MTWDEFLHYYKLMVSAARCQTFITALAACHAAPATHCKMATHSTAAPGSNLRPISQTTSRTTITSCCCSAKRGKSKWGPKQTFMCSNAKTGLLVF